MASVESRLRHLLGILSRPELTGSDVARFRRLLGHPSWKPVPHIPSINVLEPLYSHHLSRLAMDPAAVFLESPTNALSPPSFVDLMRLWTLRRLGVEDLSAAIEHSGIDRIMAFKGLAIAPLYPSPALRQMVDIDLVVAPGNVGKFRELMRSLGWNRQSTSSAETWSRAGTPFSVDLHVCRDPLAMCVMEASLPAGLIHSTARVLTVPPPTDHLILVALHSADNAGNRIWRDVCDAQALITHGASGQEALARTRGTPAAPPVEAFLAFLARWCGRRELPRQPASNEGRQLLDLFGAASVQTASPVQLELIGSMLFDAPRNLLRGLGKKYPDEPVTPSRSVERDPQLGTLPRRGTWARRRVRLSVLLHLARTGRLPKVAALAFRQARMRKNRRLFDTPKP